MKTGIKIVIVSVLLSVGAAVAWHSVAAPDGPDERIAATGSESGPHAALIAAIGDDLVDAGRNKVSSKILEDKDYVLLYFSAEWCPPCRQFTPLLAELYRKYAQKAAIEVVFISVDRSEEEMHRYMRDYDMDWLAVPYGRRGESGLAETYNLRGVPRLIALAADGSVVNDTDRHGHMETLEKLDVRFDKISG